MSTPAEEELLHHPGLETPAFVLDAAILLEDARAVRRAAEEAGIRPLFALKSFSLEAGLRILCPETAGFAASSLFEARLARRVLAPGQTVHFTTPGLSPAEIEPVCAVVDYLSFNSLSQWDRGKRVATGRVSCGLRVNPQLSLVGDERYDPCRRHSKLGIPLEQLGAAAQNGAQRLEGIEGLHFHTNCDCADLAPLLHTVDRLLDRQLAPLWERVAWVNLGGGYLFRNPAHPGALARAAERIRAAGPRTLLIEPGASITRRAGTFVASVVDLFESGGKRIAVLDTSVNHMPEVFEYQFRPDVLGHSEEGEYPYILAGAACLAGDIFGEYALQGPLRLGSRVAFPDMGAYSTVKANMFNGIRLPTIYLRGTDGVLRRVRRFEFEDFLMLCGVDDATNP